MVHARCRETIKNNNDKTLLYYQCDKCYQNFTDVSIETDREICCRYCRLKIDTDSIKICACYPVHRDCREVYLNRTKKLYNCDRCGRVFNDLAMDHNIQGLKKSRCGIKISLICVIILLIIALPFVISGLVVTKLLWLILIGATIITCSMFPCFFLAMHLGDFIRQRKLAKQLNEKFNEKNMESNISSLESNISSIELVSHH